MGPSTRWGRRTLLNLHIGPMNYEFLDFLLVVWNKSFQDSANTDQMPCGSGRDRSRSQKYAILTSTTALRLIISCTNATDFWGANVHVVDNRALLIWEPVSVWLWLWLWPCSKFLRSPNMSSAHPKRPRSNTMSCSSFHKTGWGLFWSPCASNAMSQWCVWGYDSSTYWQRGAWLD